MGWRGTLRTIESSMRRAAREAERKPVLSVKIPRQTLYSLNLPLLDASDSIKNFIHHMDFKKTKGFAAVSPVTG